MKPGPALAPELLDGPVSALAKLERYRLCGRLGAGAMAEVYEVEHLALGQRFALKVLRSEQAQNARVVERFKHEASTLARLDSPHIVRVIDAGVVLAEERASKLELPYFVMERLAGDDLRRLLEREKALPVRRALHIALQVCEALQVAHAAGIVHRDLKPENVFVSRDAQGRDLCKLLDFGVARSQAHDITQDHALIGTARYMAPEQFASDVGAGPGSDLFALGVILFECLAGKPPFDGDSMERILFRILNEPTPSLAALRPELPQELVDLVDCALAKSPEHRPESAAEFADMLRDVLSTPSSPTSAGAGPATLCNEPEAPRPIVQVVRAPATSRARRALYLALTLSVGAGIGFVAGHSATGTAANRAQDSAPVAAAPAIKPPPPVATHEPAVIVAAPAPQPAKAASAHAPEKRPKPAPAAAAATSESKAPQTSAPPLFFPSSTP